MILIVTDSMGIGALPDAELYGDAGADTLSHAVENTPGFAAPNLSRMGLGNIEGAKRRNAEGR